MDAALKQRVRERADHACEYCTTAQAHEPFLTFHIEHIIARQHGGGDDLSNLALTCPHCSLHKGPNLSGIDPVTSRIVPLFNPRTQQWRQHFHLEEGVITGLTPTGRATVRLLGMNAPDRLELRRPGMG